MRSAQTRYEQTLRVLNQATLALQQARTREEVHDAAAKEMDQLGYRVFILLLSRDGKHLHIERLAIAPAAVAQLERLTGLSADSYEIPIEFLAGHKEILEEHKAVFVSNLASMIGQALPVSTQALSAKLAAMLVLRQGVLAPLVMNGRVEGILIVSADALSEADVPVVTAFADQISAALERAHLFAELQEREWRATVAYEIAQQYARELADKVREEQARQREISAMHMVATVSADELATEEVMGRVLVAIRDLFQLDGAAIYFLDDQQRLRLGSALGMPESFLNNIRAHPPTLRDLHGGDAVLSGQPVLVQDLENLDQPIPARIRRLGVRTIANLPLRARGRLIGVMALGAQRSHALDPDDLALLTSIATQFATTLENVWLLEREQLRRAELDRLNNALRLFANQLQECRDEPAIAQLLCETVRDALGWNQAVVSLRDEDSMALHPVAQVGCSTEAVEEQTSILSSLSGDNAWMRNEFRVGHSYHIPNVSAMMARQSGQQRRELQGAAKLTDLLIIPLEAGGRSLGVLLPVEHEDGQSPTRQRIEHLELFAAQAAIAVEAIRLSKSVRMWADAVRHSGDAIVVTDLEGMILSVNPAFEELSGYRQEEVIGQNTRILNSGLTPTEAFAEMWNTVLSGGVWRGEVINQRKDGSVYDADLTAAPILDEGGEIIGLIGSHRDITRIKELDRLKSQFVSNISHELRTPLTNIKLYQKYLREGRRPELQERFFDILDRETNRLMQMIEGLLDLSRLEAGAMPFDFELLDLNKLVGKVVADFGAQAEEREITLEFEPADAAPRALAGRSQIVQAVTNLLSNALNYTPGGGNVHVSTESAEGSVLLCVRDTGFGIAPEEKEHVFERFYRGQSAKKSGVPGTGLGLGIVKQIVDLHGGTIHVESEVGEGTSVTVTLPVSEVDLAPPVILLVEDDQDILFLVANQLEGRGYRVVPAMDGESALAKLSQETPDLMVLDLLLPKVGGLQVLERLQTGEYGPPPPILVITGGKPELAHRAVALGADEFLTKPYSPQVFLDVVHRLLFSRESV